MTVPPQRPTRRHAARFLLPLLAAGLLGAPPAGAATTSAAPPRCENTRSTAADASLERLRASIVCLLRAERRRTGAGAIALDPRLATASRSHAARMVRDGFFGHVTPDGEGLTDRLRRAHWLPPGRSWAAGEILATGALPAATPLKFRDAWRRSAPHAAVVRDGGFTQIGVGLVRGNAGGGPGLTATVTFGDR